MDLHSWQDMFAPLVMLITNRPDANWRQIFQGVLMSIFIGTISGAAGAFLTLQVNDAIQETRITSVEKTVDKMETNLHNHEIRTGLHRY